MGPGRNKFCCSPRACLVRLRKCSTIHVTGLRQPLHGANVLSRVLLWLQNQLKHFQMLRQAPIQELEPIQCHGL